MRLAGALVLLLALPAVARAQSPAEARAAFEEGRAYASEEQWVQALEAFTRSRDIVERPATLFNIAAVLVRLGRAQEALATLARFEEIADPRRDARLVADVRALAESARASLRRVVIRVSPAAARVEVDGEPAEGEGAERSLTLDPGAHVVAVSHDGYETQRFSLEPGDDERDVALQPLDGTLVVRSSVTDAAIVIDGARVGTGSVTRQVPPGAHDVSLSAEGHLDFSRSVSLDPGERLVVHAALEPIPAGENLLESPLFWGLTLGGAAVVAAVAIAIAFATAGVEPPYGGSVNRVLAPLVEF